MISIVNKTTFTNPSPYLINGPITIPTTTIGNTLLMCIAYSPTIGGIQLGGVGPYFTAVEGEVIYELDDIPGGQTEITFPDGQTIECCVIYEVSPVTLDVLVPSGGWHSGSFGNVYPGLLSQPGPTLNGSGNDLYIVVMNNHDTPYLTGTYGYSGVSSPWVVDYNVAPLLTTSSGSQNYGIITSLLNTTGSQNPIFSCYSAEGYYVSTGASWTEVKTSPCGPTPPVGNPYVGFRQ